MQMANLRLRLAIERTDRAVRLAAGDTEGSEAGIDYLDTHAHKWQTITPTRDGVGFRGMPASSVIPCRWHRRGHVEQRRISQHSLGCLLSAQCLDVIAFARGLSEQGD